jgi:drug/metabolite transporter (DMT)-like permease
VSKDSRAPYVWMLLGSFLFANMGVMANYLGQSCDWQVIALARCALALLFTLILIALYRVRLAVFKPGILWVRSLAGSISMVCSFYALAHLPVSDVLTLTNMFPLWVALLSWRLEGQAPHPSLWLAILCAIAGVALIQQPHLASGNWATLVALVSSFFTAVAMLGLNKIKGVDHRAIVAHFSTVATAFAVVALFVFPRSHPIENHFTRDSLLLLLAVGVTATFGQIFLTKAFSAGDPTRVSVVGLTQIAFAMILGAVFLRHGFDATRILGTVLVMAPTGWVMLQRRTPARVVEPKAPAVSGPHRKVGRVNSAASQITPAEGVIAVPSR